MNRDHERRLVEAAARDPVAFRELYACYFPKVYAYIGYRVGRAEETEDLTAETFLKMVEGLERFRWQHDGSFAAWLFRIAHNVVNDFYRQNQRREEPLPLAEFPEIRVRGPAPDGALEKKETFARLHRLIRTLSPRRQEVITLKFFGGLRNQEIAAILELDERTVASHLCRGLRDLQRKYMDESAESYGQKSHERERYPDETR